MKAHCYTKCRSASESARVQGKLRNEAILLTFSVVRKRDGRTLIKTYGNPLGLATSPGLRQRRATTRPTCW